MNQEPINLEQALTEMTTWRGAEPHVWQSALAEDEQAPKSTGVLTRAIFWRMPMALAASIAVVITGGMLFTLLVKWDDAGRVTSTATMAPERDLRGGTALMYSISPSPGSSPANAKQLGSAGADVGEWSERSMAYATDSLQRPAAALRLPRGGDATTETSGTIEPRQASNSVGAAGGSAAFTPPTTESADRQVVRKATVELEAADVRGVFLKAGMLVSEAGGEYIEQSSLIGEKESAQANLTLRVAAERMHAVLTALHDLGHVRSETQGGEDVTAAIVDLDARLRNEQRVEKELLELLDKRTDAPLNDILQLRTEIARVRQVIEQIAGQQQRLSRLVSLATILVIIRPESKTPETQPAAEKPSLGKYFGESFKDSWSCGMHFLADTLAGLMGVLVGGAIWWIALIISLLALRQHLRRKAGLA